MAFVTRNYVAATQLAGWTATGGSAPREEAGSGWIRASTCGSSPIARESASPIRCTDAGRAAAALERLVAAEPGYPPAQALLAAARCGTREAADAASAFAALARQGFGVAAYLGALGTHLAAAGREGSVAPILDAARGAGIDVRGPAGAPV